MPNVHVNTDSDLHNFRGDFSVQLGTSLLTALANNGILPLILQNKAIVRASFSSWYEADPKSADFDGHMLPSLFSELKIESDVTIHICSDDCWTCKGLFVRQIADLTLYFKELSSEQILMQYKSYIDSVLKSDALSEEKKQELRSIIEQTNQETLETELEAEIEQMSQPTVHREVLTVVTDSCTMGVAMGLAHQANEVAVAAVRKALGEHWPQALDETASGKVLSRALAPVTLIYITRLFPDKVPVADAVDVGAQLALTTNSYEMSKLLLEKFAGLFRDLAIIAQAALADTDVEEDPQTGQLVEHLSEESIELVDAIVVESVGGHL